MLKPTKVKIVKKIYSFSPSREGCILVLRVEDVRSKQNEIGINWGGGGVQRSINRQQPMGSNSYYVLCRYVCACAQTPIKENGTLLLFGSQKFGSLELSYFLRLFGFRLFVVLRLFGFRLFGSQKFGSLDFCLRVNSLFVLRLFGSQKFGSCLRHFIYKPWFFQFNSFGS